MIEMGCCQGSWALNLVVDISLSTLLLRIDESIVTD